MQWKYIEILLSFRCCRCCLVLVKKDRMADRLNRLLFCLLYDSVNGMIYIMLMYFGMGVMFYWYNCRWLSYICFFYCIMIILSI